MSLELNTKVKAYREIHGVSQKEFAESVGIGKSTVSDIENGKTLSKKTVEKVEAFFDSISAPAPKRKPKYKPRAKKTVTAEPVAVDEPKVVSIPAEDSTSTADDIVTSISDTVEPIEVVFSFDTTGSMYPCLTQVRRNVQEMVKRLFSEIPNIRIGIIAHGDYCDANYPGHYVTKTLDITDNQNEICRFVNSVGSTYGGDAPECYELVLHEARSLNWTSGKKKVLVVIGDDVPHPPSYPENTLNLDWRNELGLLLEAGINVYAVQALGRRHSTQFYREMAERTGGFHLNLDQFSDIRDLVMSVCYKQQGDSQLQNFYDDIQRKGKMTRSKSKFLSKMLGITPTAIVKHKGSAVEGRFQSMEIDYDCSIKEFVEAQGLAFKAGKGFYEWTSKKSSIIQAYKEVLLIHDKTGDVIMGNEARAMLGLPEEGISTGKKVRPLQVKGYTPFIQSTSYNRKLIGGSTFLYEVEDWEYGRV